MKICEEPWFVEIFKMIRGVFLKWTGSCGNRSKVTSFSTNVSVNSNWVHPPPGQPPGKFF